MTDTEVDSTVPTVEELVGVFAIPNITVPPDTFTNTDELPYEKEPRVPSPIIANFRGEEHNPRGTSDLDKFNDLGQNIPRDDNNLVKSQDELLEKMNEYDYSESTPGAVIGGLSWIVCFPLLAKRRTIEPGNFGYYRASGKDKLVPPGIHTLTSAADYWMDTNVPIFDARQHERNFGAKTILTVPENHIAVAERINSVDGKDNEFVVFSQGRHVLKSENYTAIKIAKTDRDIVEVGPLKVLYVKEGKIGGAFERNKGEYRIFLPGAPYLLHEMNYQDVVCVDRTFGKFAVGPVTFLTVKDGEIGGAYHKRTGLFQILPPGNTYVLHSKDYDGAVVKERTDKFKLGPFYFITVRKGNVAGAFRKQGGKFIDLPPGHTYQLNEEHYYEPELVPRESHCVTCGPKTYLTVKKGTLNGAYKVSDGSFVEFEAEGEEYVLHREEFRDIVTIPRISYELQEFGPMKIITIPEGFAGIFEKGGEMEIAKTGFYKLSSEYTVKPNIPLKVFTNVADDLKFFSKDGIEMSITANISWKVSDPMKVAIYPGSFEQVSQDILKQFNLTLLTKCRTYNRDELLPTKQDIIVKGGDITDEESLELLKKADQEKSDRYKDIAENVLAELVSTSTSANWGLDIVTVTLRGFELLDKAVRINLAKITQDLMAIKAQQVEGKRALEQVRIEQQKKMREAETNEMVSIKETESNVAVKRKEAEARVSLQKSEAEAQALVEQHRKLIEAETELKEAKAKSEAQVVIESAKAKADAEARRIKLEIENEEKRLTAETDANASKLLAEAEAERTVTAKEAEAHGIELIAKARIEEKQKEYEVARMKPEHEIKLELAQEATRAAEHFSRAAWKHPEAFIESLHRVEAETGFSIVGAKYAANHPDSAQLNLYTKGRSVPVLMKDTHDLPNESEK